MSSSIYADSDSDKGRWKKSITKDGVTKCIEARKIDNGYIVTVQKYGNRKNSEGENEYFDDTKEIFTKENPFEDLDDEFKEEKKLIEDMKKSVYSPSIFD